MSLTLADALSRYSSVSDTTHKFWGYYQILAAGTATVAWTTLDRNLEEFVFLSMAFAIFAALNLRLVVSSQREAVLAKECIQNFARRSSAEVPVELRPMIEKISPDGAITVGLWHAGLSVATVAAVWWRYHSF